jgi:hypothetical protein
VKITAAGASPSSSSTFVHCAAIRFGRQKIRESVVVLLWIVVEGRER